MRSRLPVSQPGRWLASTARRPLAPVTATAAVLQHWMHISLDSLTAFQSPIRARGTALAAAASTLAIAGGCGEETMSADEFLSTIEEQGVSLELTDDELITDDPGKELYGLELEPFTEGEGGGGGGGGGGQEEERGAHLHGSLAVYDDTDGADGGLEGCRAAADLLCYQAANIVVILEGGGIEAQRLAVAMQMLGEE